MPLCARALVQPEPAWCWLSSPTSAQPSCVGLARRGRAVCRGEVWEPERWRGGVGGSTAPPGGIVGVALGQEGVWGRLPGGRKRLSEARNHPHPGVATQSPVQGKPLAKAVGAPRSRDGPSCNPAKSPGWVAKGRRPRCLLFLLQVTEVASSLYKSTRAKRTLSDDFTEGSRSKCGRFSRTPNSSAWKCL